MFNECKKYKFDRELEKRIPLTNYAVMVAAIVHTKTIQICNSIDFVILFLLKREN